MVRTFSLVKKVLDGGGPSLWSLFSPSVQRRVCLVLLPQFFFFQSNQSNITKESLEGALGQFTKLYNPF